MPDHSQPLLLLIWLGIVGLALITTFNFRRIRMTLDDLKAKVDAQTTVIKSAETLLGQLSTLIRDNSNDPVKLQAIADELDANSAELSAAVAANTPAAPAP